MIKLNNNIKDKFNKLFFEVAEYYKLTDKLHKTSAGIYAISAKDLGCIEKEMFTVDILLNTIRGTYPYLIPFVKIFKAYIFIRIGEYQDYVSEETFKEINIIIKKIRKENLDTGIKVT